MKIITNKPLFEKSEERQIYKALSRKGYHTNPNYSGFSTTMVELSQKIELDALKWGIKFHPQAGEGKVDLLISKDRLVDFSNVRLPLRRQSCNLVELKML